MHKAGYIFGSVVFLSAAMQAQAQDPIDMPIAEVLALTSQPYLGRDAFRRALLSAVPGLVSAPNTANSPILKRFAFYVSRMGFTGKDLSDSLQLGGGSWASLTLWIFESGFAHMLRGAIQRVLRGGCLV